MSYRPHPTKGPGWWQIWSRPNGRKGKQRVILFYGTEAEASAADQESKLAAISKKKVVTICPYIRDTINDYLSYYSLEHLDTTNVTRHLFRWRRYVGNLLFPEVNASHVEQFKHDRIDAGIKPTTINKELSALCGLLKWAAKKGYCQQPTFFERFGNKKTKAPLPDVPTRAEVLALINSMIWPKCGYFACLYYAGLRAGEAEGLRAEDVHLDRRLMIVRGKGNKQRVVPIVDELMPWMVKRLAEVKSGILWTTRSGRPMTETQAAVRWAKERAGITRRIYPHLLRHAFGTHSTMAGVGLRALQNAMGHTSSHTTEIYTTLSTNAVIDEITGKFGKV